MFIASNFYSSYGYADLDNVDYINMILERIYLGDITKEEESKIKKGGELIQKKTREIEQLGEEVRTLQEGIKTIMEDIIKDQKELDLLKILILKIKARNLGEEIEKKNSELNKLNDSFDQLTEEFINTLKIIKNRQEDESKKEMDTSLDNIPGQD